MRTSKNKLALILTMIASIVGLTMLPLAAGALQISPPALSNLVGNSENDGHLGEAIHLQQRQNPTQGLGLRHPVPLRSGRQRPADDWGEDCLLREV